MTGAEMIAAERRRQVEEEGWTEQHDDDEHADGQLAAAASLLLYEQFEGPLADLESPADVTDWVDHLILKMRKAGGIRRLAVAGALVAAEIDRLQRLAVPAAHQEGE